MTSNLRDELHTLLPGWVAWVGPTIAVLVLGFTYLLVRFTVVAAYLRQAEREAEWTERARFVHAARVTAMVATIVLPVWGIVAAVAFVGPIASVPRWLAALILGVLGAVAGFLSSAVVERHVHGPSEEGLINSGLGLMLGYGPIAVLVVMGWFAPPNVTSWLMLPWLVVLTGVIHTWLRAPLLLLRTPLAAPGGDRTSRVVERAAASLSMAVDRVIELRTRQPNAFAFPWLGTLGFTTGLLDALDEEELEAITFHELAHLRESPGLTRLRQAQLYALIPIVATRPILGTVGIVGPLLSLAGFVVVTEIVRRRGLAAEHASDAAAVESIHHSEVLGRALEKTYRLGMIPAVLRRSTHGQLHERLEAAGLEPGFEPPAPPPRGRSRLALAGAVAVLAAGWFSPWLLYALADESSYGPTYLAAALPVYQGRPLESLAFDAELDERWVESGIFYEAAASVSPDDSFPRVEAVRSWAYAGDCGRAAASADLLGSAADVEDRRYAKELIDWCELTGGLPSSG